MTDIKTRLFEFRQATGLSIQDIATEINYAPHTVYNYIGGRKGSAKIGAAISRFIAGHGDQIIGPAAALRDQLTDIRDKNGLSVYDIAAQTGICKSAVAQFLAGTTCGPKVHRAIAQFITAQTGTPAPTAPRQIGFLATASAEDGGGSKPPAPAPIEKGHAAPAPVPVDTTDDEQLCAELREIMESHDISQAAAARAIGISGSALSGWMSGKYKGDKEKVKESVRTYLILHRERAALPQNDIKFVNTSVSKKVFEVARIAHRDNEIALVYGDAGLGKTRAVHEYTAANPDVILIEADLGYSAKVLFIELCRRLNIDPGQSLHDMLDAVVHKLRATGRLIIVDEAEHLPYKALEMLRRVYDKAGTGILLVGMPRLLFNLRGKRGEYAQLYSRVGIATKIEHLRESDTEALIKSAIPGTNGVWKTFHKESFGNTRRLVKLISRSQRVATINKIPLNAEVVEEASKLLII